MKVHKCKQPKGLIYDYDEKPTKLDRNDIRSLERFELDEIWYWNTEGDYEGNGILVMRKGDLWDYHDMSHCSCYGPIDEAEFKGRYASYEAMLDACSEEFTTEFETITRYIKCEN